jgi:uncharacterized protein (DUF2236 family)
VTSALENSVRFFDVESEIWKVNRETVLLLAGGRALLMQLAHPKVAAGVADHSRFQEDPFSRLYRTMNTMWSIVFDERSEADAALERVESVHRKVRGVVAEDESSFARGDYDALDQDLLLWVHATLIESAMIAYDRFVAPLSNRERDAYYDDSRTLARLFGVEETIIPFNLREFEQYMKQMLAGDRIAVGPTARNLAQEILHARPWIFKSAGPLFRFITAGLLPEQLRNDYGLRWSKRNEKLFGALAAVIRSARPLVPAPLRIVPNARRAEKVEPGPKR